MHQPQKNKSKLLLRDAYGRHFAIFRMSEMLLAGATGRGGPLEVRVEQGVPGWDDLLEEWPAEGGGRQQHRWQVKYQSTEIPQDAFTQLIRALAAPGADFIGRLALRNLVKVAGLGELRVLRDLCKQVHGNEVRVKDVDFSELHRKLNGEELQWIQAIVNELRKGTDPTANDESVLVLLRRLRVEVFYEETDLKKRAINNLDLLFNEPEEVWNALNSYIEANYQSQFRFTAPMLRSTPLRGYSARSVAGQVGHFDLERYLECKLGIWRRIDKRIETGLESKQDLKSFEELSARVMSSRGLTLMVTGPSGCGKSLLLASLSVHLAEQGGVPVLAEAAGFKGNLKSWLDEAVEPLEEGAFQRLASAAGAAGRHIILLVDGLEEARKHEKSLLNGLETSGEYRGFSIVLAGQKQPESMPPDVDIVEVRLPDLEMKSRLFAMFRTADGEQSLVDSVIESISTPLEVKLAAQAYEELPAHPTLHQLFDAYTRLRLQKIAGQEAIRPCFKLFIRLAEWMGENFSTSIESSQFRRLVECERMSAYTDSSAMALHAGLLVQRGRYIRFQHEMFRMFFEAEGLLQKHQDDIETLAELTELPKYRNLGEFMLGALDDGEKVSKYIGRCVDFKVLLRALKGRLGRVVRQVACKSAKDLLQKIREEMTALPPPSRERGVQEALSALPPWSDSNKALVCAVGASLRAGLFWEDVIQLINSVDRAWLRVRPIESWQIQTYDEVVSCLYVQHSDVMLSALIQSVRHAFIFKRYAFVFEKSAGEDGPLDQAVLSILEDSAVWTPGVLLILSEIDCWSMPALRAWLVPWFDACWDSKLYHVRLGATKILLRLVDDIQGDMREALVQRLEGIWQNECSRVLGGPSEDIVNLLVVWGRRSPPSDGYLDAARYEVEAALAEVESEEACSWAYSVYEGQTDVLGDAYCQAVGELTAEQRSLLLLRAAKGGLKETVIAPTYLLQELILMEDVRIIDILLPWARIGMIDAFMMNGSGVRVFVYANAGLGRIGCVNIGFDDISDLPRDRVWGLIGAMVRRVNAGNFDRKNDWFVSCWKVLVSEEPWFVLDVLRQVSETCWSDSTEQIRSWIREPVELFPDDACRLAKIALEMGVATQRERLGGITGWSHEPVSYAIFILERFGDVSCEALLKGLANDKDWGDAAIDALRAIRERVRGEDDH